MSYDKLKPNFSQIPNVIFDEWMKELDSTEFKIVMVIARKTYGWHKSSDQIALSQYIDMTGLSKNGVKEAIKRLIEKGYVRKLKDGGGSDIGEYEIAYSKEEGGQSTTLFAENTGSAGDPHRVAQRPSTPPKGGQPATPQNKDLNKLSKDTPPPSALIEKIKDVTFKGYENLTKKKLSWKGKETMYGKCVREIAKKAMDCNPEDPYTEVVERGRFLVNLIKDEVRNDRRKFYSRQGFTPHSLNEHWNSLVDMLGVSTANAEVKREYPAKKDSERKPEANFPEYRKMSPNEIRESFKSWNVKWSMNTVKEKITAKMWDEWAKVHKGKNDKLAEAIINNLDAVN